MEPLTKYPALDSFPMIEEILFLPVPILCIDVPIVKRYNIGRTAYDNLAVAPVKRDARQHDYRPAHSKDQRPLITSLLTCYDKKLNLQKRNHRKVGK